MIKVRLESRLDTLFPSVLPQIIIEESFFRCSKTAFQSHFPTKNSLVSEVTFMLKTIFLVQSDEHSVNNFPLKIRVLIVGKGLVTI